MARPTRHRSNGGLDPRTYQQILGSTFANHDHRPLIVIGTRQWDRWQLGRMGCPHPSAALRVNRVIKTLQIKTVAEFVSFVPAFAQYRDLGVASYWVVLSLLHDLGHDIEEVHGDNPTFLTMHRHILKKSPSRGRRGRRAAAAATTATE